MLVLWIAVTGLGACATTGDETPAPDAAASPVASQSPEPVPQPEPEETEYGNFSEDQLYRTIVSELNAQRGDLEAAGEDYFDLAFETRDLRIIERAVQFASANGDTNALLQLGMLWAEVNPDSPRPHLMLSFQFLESGRFDQALIHMARVLEMGGDIDFSALANRTGRLSQGARGGLIQNLQELKNRYPQNVSIRVSLAQLLAQNRQYDESLTEMAELNEMSDPVPQRVLLQAQIYQQMGDSDAALQSLRDGVRRFAEDKTLRLNYARLLIQEADYREAQRQFQALIDLDPDDWETLYSIGLLDLEMENYDSAESIFSRLVEAEQRYDEAQFYLGFINEQRGDLPAAITHYRAVRVGTNNFLAAQQQATQLSIRLGELEDAHDWLASLSIGQPRLEVLFNTVESAALIQAGYPDEARALLDRALNRFPGEIDLLFARVLYYDSQNDMVGSERDLRHLIAVKPDDARALNHLGYMLADRTDRYTEALELAERAIALEPEDPAIIDTLGWAQYKVGQYEPALENLRKAYALFPDDEVASHLGEVLWIMGREDEALEVWREALEAEPDSEFIADIIQRFDPPL